METMMGFKPQLALNGLPRIDDFIRIWIDPNVPQKARPDWEPSDSDYMILTGQDNPSISKLMTEVNHRGQELSAFFCSNYPSGSWDVMIKPVMWIESLDAALDLYKTISSLDEGDQAEILTDIQLEFDEPWGMVSLITDDIWSEIKARYD